MGGSEVAGDAANPVVITLSKTDTNPNPVIGGVIFDPIPEPSTGLLSVLAGDSRQL